MMKKLIAGAALTLTLSFTATAAQADTLADILGEPYQFDRNQNDFDIVTSALDATGLLPAAADPNATLTAFLPTDRAFRILVDDLYGISIKNEEALFDAIVDTLGPAAVTDVLKYHLVGSTLMAADVLAAGDGYQVDTLLDGEYFTLRIRGKGKYSIRLVDNAVDLRDPIVRITDIEADNGVAHVIDRVLLP